MRPKDKKIIVTEKTVFDRSQEEGACHALGEGGTEASVRVHRGRRKDDIVVSERSNG